jgi:soluble lytic murein transglycosylase
VVAAAVAFAVLRGPGLYARATHPLYQQDTIAAAASAERVDPYLIAAMVNVESGFRTTVRSSAGAVGLMQVLPSTAGAVAHRLGIAGKMTETALQDPVTNIRVGTAYFGELLARYHDDPRLALAAYNGGISNADRWVAKWTPGMSDSQAVHLIDFPETVKYVGEVLAQAKVYRSLYPTSFAHASTK